MDTNSFKPQNTLAAAAAACELRNCMSVFEAQNGGTYFRECRCWLLSLL
jgi:hypothetical protein